MVVVAGRSFADTEQLACRFGANTVVKAAWRSTTSVECVAPSHAPGAVRVVVSNNGVDFSSTFSNFTYAGVVTVDTISPASGTVRGGTLVVVKGTHFASTPSLRCHFGLHQTPARFISDTEIRCFSPAAMARAAVAFNVTTNGADFSSLADRW